LAAGFLAGAAAFFMAGFFAAGFLAAGFFGVAILGSPILGLHINRFRKHSSRFNITKSTFWGYVGWKVKKID
jgi:hypothetical protein